MKRLLLIYVVLFLGKISAEGTTITNQDKYYYLCKVWGYAKFFNTENMRRMEDYDILLLDILHKLDTVHDLDDYNVILSTIITIDENDFYTKKDKIDSIKKQLHLRDRQTSLQDTNRDNFIEIYWIINNDVLNKNVQDRLIYAKVYGKEKNRKLSKVGLTGIKNIHSLRIPALNMKWEHFMLGYFTYWNLVEYYFPYKIYMDSSWDSVLYKMIVDIYQTKSIQDYTFTLKKMAGHLDDSHAGVGFPKGVHESHFGYTRQSQWFPAKFTFIEDTLVVTATHSVPNLSPISGLMVGDIITHINDEPVEKFKSEIEQYLSCSSEAEKDKKSGFYLTNGYLSIQDSVIQLKVLRDQMERSIVIRKDLSYSEWSTIGKNEPIVNSTSCMYMDFSQGAGALRRKFRNLHDSCCWIIDLRNYPSSYVGVRLAKYLRTKPQPVAKFSHPSKNEPGLFQAYHRSLSFYYSNKFDFLLNAFFPSIQAKIFPTFRTDTFSGKIYVIIGTYTKSYGETIAMILKSYRQDAVFIGTNTSGTNGNVVSLEIPGGIEVFFTGIDFHYASGERLQRIGVQPDISTPIHVSTIQSHKDHVFDQVIKNCSCK